MAFNAVARLGVNNLVVWRDAFEKITTELDLTKRKKQTLDDLMGSGRISQNTHDSLCKGLDDDIFQIEIRRKALAEKMANKLTELEEQMQTLEYFLANSEMAYAAGEINDELHANESSALSLGLEATKQELNWIKEVIIQLVPKENVSTTLASATVETVQATSAEAATENTPPVTNTEAFEPPVELTPVAGESAIENPGQVAVQTTAEAPFPGESGNAQAQEEKKEQS